MIRPTHSPRFHAVQTRLRGSQITAWRYGLTGQWRDHHAAPSWARGAIGTGTHRRLKNGLTITTAWVWR